MEWKNLILREVYGAQGYTMEQLLAWLDRFGGAIRPFIADTGAWLRQAQADGKSILFEGQLGALRDLDFGIYPYTTSSNTIAAYAPVGSGLPGAKLDEVVGVVKAYSSCVGGKAPSPASGSARRPRNCGRPATSTVPRQADPAG